MNFLAHFALSNKDQNLSIGSFLGDFVKGRLSGQYNQEIEIGIKFHRAVDAYTDHHLLTRLSRERFGTRFKRIGGIMTDIAYDHLLALSWDSFYDETLSSFSKRVLEDILAYKNLPRDTCIFDDERNTRMGLYSNTPGFTKADSYHTWNTYMFTYYHLRRVPRSPQDNLYCDRS